MIGRIGYPVTAAIVELIKKAYIERYNQVLNNHKSSPEEKKKAQDQINYWQESIKSIEETGEFDRIAENRIHDLLRKLPPGAAEVEDISQDIALKILNFSPSQIDELANKVKDLAALRKYFKALSYLRAIYEWRKMVHHQPYGEERERVEDGRKVVPWEHPVEQKEWSEEKEQEVLESLNHYAHQRLNSEQRALFDRLMEMASSLREEKISITQDVIKPLVQKIPPAKRKQTINRLWVGLIKVRNVILSFFEHELDYEVPKRVKDKIVPEARREDLDKIMVMATLKDAGAGLSDSQLYGRIKRQLEKAIREIKQRFPNADLHYVNREVKGKVNDHEVWFFYKVLHASNGETAGFPVIIIDRYKVFDQLGGGSIADNLEKIMVKEKMASITDDLATIEYRRKVAQWILADHQRELRIIDEAEVKASPFRSMLDYKVVTRGSLQQLKQWAAKKGLEWKSKPQELFKGYWVDKKNGDAYLIT